MKLALCGGEQLIPEKLEDFKHPILSRAVVDWLRNEKNLESVTTFDAVYITELQERLKQLFNLKHTVVTNSGTSAIFEMFYTLDLKPGDEVIVPVYTFFATAMPLFVLGCKPILADCRENGNIDPTDIERKVTSKTKAIIITHMWGIPCDMDEIVAVSKKYNIPLLEDVSHAHGATYHGKILGTFGKSAAWSLGTKKIISGGQGGVFGTNHQDIYEKAILTGHTNNKRLNDVQLEELLPLAITGTGLNLRMHPYAAKVIIDQCDTLAQQLQDRRAIADYFTTELTKIRGLTVPKVPENSQSSWYAFPVFFDADMLGVTKEKFVQAVVAEGAYEVDIPGSTCPLTEFAVFRKGLIDYTNVAEDLYTIDQFPGAKLFQKKMFKLPMWYGQNGMKYAQAYMQAINKVVQNIDQLK